MLSQEGFAPRSRYPLILSSHTTGSAYLQRAAEHACDLHEPVGEGEHLQPHHLADVVALFGGKVVQGFGEHSRVVLQEGLSVVLKPLTLLPVSP